jgi:delta24(24(1))-sterol reductase
VRCNNNRICNNNYSGKPTYPSSIDDISGWFGRMYQHIVDDAMPTWFSVKIYWGFLAFEAILSVVAPGPLVKGLPIPHEGGKQLVYKCSGVTSWYITLGVAFFLHNSGLFPLETLMDHLGPLTTTAVCLSLSLIYSFLTHDPLTHTMHDVR